MSCEASQPVVKSLGSTEGGEAPRWPCVTTESLEQIDGGATPPAPGSPARGLCALGWSGDVVVDEDADGPLRRELVCQPIDDERQGMVR